MRSIWKGAISFGLVSIPVKLYSATEERDVSFHQVHRTDAGRVRYKRVCQIDGEEVSYGDIAKGYELDSGEVVVLTDEDFADLPLSSSRSIDVLEFVPLEQVDPMYFTKSYYLEPEASGAKPYVLLRQALESSGRVALVKIALRQRESLATLRVHDDVFVLEMMLWPDEIRPAQFGFLDEKVEVRSQELSMATSLIDTLSGDFDPTQYTDDYRAALEALIEAKVSGREVVSPEEPAGRTGQVVDLMSALRASVDAAKTRRGQASDAEDDSGEQDAAEPAPKQRAPSTKTAARKSPAHKTAARKPASRKQASSKTAPASSGRATKPDASKKKSASGTVARGTGSTRTTAKSTASQRSGTRSSASSDRPRRSA